MGFCGISRLFTFEGLFTFFIFQFYFLVILRHFGIIALNSSTSAIISREYLTNHWAIAHSGEFEAWQEKTLFLMMNSASLVPGRVGRPLRSSPCLTPMRGMSKCLAALEPSTHIRGILPFPDYMPLIGLLSVIVQYKLIAFLKGIRYDCWNRACKRWLPQSCNTICWQHFRKLLADQCLVKAHVAMPGKRAKAAPSAIAPHPERTDPSASFLLDTLRKTQSLHSRNAASYVTVRRWRSALKPYQIAALQALKPVPPKSFLDVVTKEMAETAVHLFGNQTIAAVVPVPGGSCGAGKSLSEHLAENLAKQLDCPYRAVLRRQAAATGKSHPKKSVKLQPYEIDEKIEGIVLLVDDVATSGRHLELAQATLRNAGAVCLAMAWIGT